MREESSLGAVAALLGALPEKRLEIFGDFEGAAAAWSLAVRNPKDPAAVIQVSPPDVDHLASAQREIGRDQNGQVCDEPQTLPVVRPASPDRTTGG